MTAVTGHPVIELRDIGFRYDEQEVLRHVDLSLDEGELVLVSGRTGVGKSTLLKCIGYNQLAGFPSNIRVLYVEQLEGADMCKTVVRFVMDANHKAARARRELKIVQGLAKRAST